MEVDSLVLSFPRTIRELGLRLRLSSKKNLPATQETPEMRVQSLGWEDSPEEDMATCSSILAWRAHGQRSLLGYSS